MFRCFFQPRSTTLPPKWLPSLNNAVSGSRGLLRLAEFRANTSPNKIIRGPGLRDGEYYQRLLRQQDIQPQKVMYALRNLSKPGISIFVSKTHAYDRSADQYISRATPGSANSEAFARRILRQHREKPLWRLFNAYSTSRQIIKGKLRVRVLSAWYQALRNHGYGRDGEPYVKGKKGAKELFGTVEIRTQYSPALLDWPFVELRAHLETVVKALEVHLGRPAGGQEMAKASSQPVMAVEQGYQTKTATATQRGPETRDRQPVFSLHPKPTVRKNAKAAKDTNGHHNRGPLSRPPSQANKEPWK